MLEQKLSMEAWHRLEHSGHVTINEAGKLTRPTTKGAVYLIRLKIPTDVVRGTTVPNDENNRNCWIRCKYTNVRNESGEFIPEETGPVVRPIPDFIPVSAYIYGNYKSSRTRGLA